MERARDAADFFGLNYLVGGMNSTEPKPMAKPKKEKTAGNLNEQSARAQTMNTTNRSRESRKYNG